MRISEKLRNILTDKDYKIIRIDTEVSEGEYYLKQGVKGSYEIYKAAGDFSYAELLMIGRQVKHTGIKMDIAGVPN